MLARSQHGRKARESTSTGYQKSARVTIDDETRDALQRIGNGNISAGIRKAVRILKEVNDALSK